MKFRFLRPLKIAIKKLRGLPLSPSVREFRVDGHLVAEVTLTEEMIHETNELAPKIRRIARKKDLPEVISGDLQKEIVGLQGHFAWFEYAFGYWREGLQYLSIGEGDITDSSFRGYAIDVKTRSQPWHDLIMMPKEQFGRKQHDFYIGAQRRNPHVIWIWGYATREDVIRAELCEFGHGDTYVIPLRDLKPIDDLLLLKKRGD